MPQPMLAILGEADEVLQPPSQDPRSSPRSQIPRSQSIQGDAGILTTPDEVETWMTAPLDEALRLERPLPDGSLRIVARGVKEDSAGSVT